MKVALVHDDFIQQGGGEKLFESISQIFPKAPVYTALVKWSELPSQISQNRVRPSFIQKIPFSTKFYKLLLPLYPLAFESFDFSGFDLVISSTARFAKSIITSPKTIHICYINSVPRFLYDSKKRKTYLPKKGKFLLGPFLNWLKRWDMASSSRVDFYIANSENIREKVANFYGRESQVIYPFADLSVFIPPKLHKWFLKSQSYYLIVSRLVKWKKIDIAVKAAQNLNLNLKIVGTGPDEARLKNLAKSSNGKAEFIGRAEQEKLISLYQNARALIVTQDEDFGISAVEAQACGTPVIALKSGGAKEIVQEGQSGIFFQEQTSQSLEDAINRVSRLKWSVSACRKNAMRFSKDRFVKEIKSVVKINGS